MVMSRIDSCNVKAAPGVGGNACWNALLPTASAWSQTPRSCRRSCLSAREALHVAIMEAQGVQRILTFDTGFDEYAGIERVQV